MNLRQPVTARTAIVVVLVFIYAVALVALIAASRREAALAVQVSATEAAVVQTANSVQGSAPALRANLAVARERVASLESRVPKQLQTDIFDRAATDAQNSGISGFSYQRKGEFLETLQAGTYKVYRFMISGRGDQEKIIAFLDGLQRGASQTLIVENVSLTAVGQEWQMSADIVVYTSGG